VQFLQPLPMTVLRHLVLLTAVALDCERQMPGMTDVLVERFTRCSKKAEGSSVNHIFDRHRWDHVSILKIMLYLFYLFIYLNTEHLNTFTFVSFVIFLFSLSRRIKRNENKLIWGTVSAVHLKAFQNSSELVLNGLSANTGSTDVSFGQSQI
jgi:hypothetical protein